MISSLWIFVLIVGGLLFADLLIVWRWRKAKAVLRGASGPIESISFKEALIRFTSEIDRARRYGRKLSLVVVGVDDGHLVQHGNNSDFESDEHKAALQYLRSLVSDLLRENLRDSDYVVYDAAQNCCVLLLTESSYAVAEEAMTRMHKLVYERVQINIRYGIADYPKDGLILQDLVTCGYNRYRQQAIETNGRLNSKSFQIVQKSSRA